MKPGAIPDFLSHLRVYKGLPVPFFTAVGPDGTPDFRAHSPERHSRAIRTGLCGICGKKLAYWKFVVVGPNELRMAVTYMPALHEECARYALEVCPFLAMQEREMGDVRPGQVRVTDVVLTKPERIALVRTNGYRVVYPARPKMGFEYVRFSPPKRVDWFRYVDGKLEAEHE